MSPGLNSAKLIYSEFPPVLSLSIFFFFMVIFLGKGGEYRSLSIHHAVHLIEIGVNGNDLSKTVKYLKKRESNMW